MGRFWFPASVCLRAGWETESAGPGGVVDHHFTPRTGSPHRQQPLLFLSFFPLLLPSGDGIKSQGDASSSSSTSHGVDLVRSVTFEILKLPFFFHENLVAEACPVTIYMRSCLCNPIYVRRVRIKSDCSKRGDLCRLTDRFSFLELLFSHQATCWSNNW